MVETLSFAPAEGCKFCPRGMDIDWGNIECVFFFNLYKRGKAQVNHLSRGMEWVVIFPEGSKHQVNHMSQDIDLVLIYRRGAKHKVKHLPRWMEWF